MKRFLTILGCLILLAVSAKCLEMKTVFKEDGTLFEIVFIDFTPEGDPITVRIGSEEADLSLDVKGELINKEAVKTLANTRWKAEKAKIQAEKQDVVDKEADKESKKIKLKLTVTKEDLEK